MFNKGGTSFDEEAEFQYHAEVVAGGCRVGAEE
jgi:hypothetical protein